MYNFKYLNILYAMLYVSTTYGIDRLFLVTAAHSIRSFPAANLYPEGSPGFMTSRALTKEWDL